MRGASRAGAGARGGVGAGGGGGDARDGGTGGAPLLIALPDGLNVSGVVLWAVRLVNTLAARGRATGLVMHAEPRGQSRLNLPIDARVRVFHAERLARLGETGGDLSPFIPLYRDAVRALHSEGGGPVVFSPNLHGDCYGIGAALSLVDPERIRLVGWQHSDNGYDRRVLEHYEPALSAFVGVSDRIVEGLRAGMPGRRGDVVGLPYGVPVPARCPRRARSTRAGGRPIRLIYTGRMEHHQKRVLALPLLSDELARRDVPHSLTLIGDGPASGEVDRAISERAGDAVRNLRRLPPPPAEELVGALDRADAFVLPSRFEGLSVSMLEAMARGCVPVVTRVLSGAAQAIEDGTNGMLADAGPDEDETTTAAALADAVERLASADMARMSMAAYRCARRRFGLARHADAAGAMIDRVAAGPARAWPAWRPCAFSAGAGGGREGENGGWGGSGGWGGWGGSGSVPVDGPARLAAVLGALAGRTIVLHGAGAHTVGLAAVLGAHTGGPGQARVAAVCDDDRARWGSCLLGYPVISPGAAKETGATDVVISTWMHEGAVWGRRGVYEAQGMRVWRVYE